MIYFFDIDGTLVNTDAKVRVTTDTGVSFGLTTEDMRNLPLDDLLGSGDISVDFSEFNSFDKLLSGEKTPIWEVLDMIHDADPSKIHILTARGNREGIRLWLALNGINNRPERIHCFGEPVMKPEIEDPTQYPWEWFDETLFSSVHDWKAAWVAKIGECFNEPVTVYEDDSRNIESIWNAVRSSGVVGSKVVDVLNHKEYVVK